MIFPWATLTISDYKLEMAPKCVCPDIVFHYEFCKMWGPFICQNTELLQKSYVRGSEVFCLSLADVIQPLVSTPVKQWPAVFSWGNTKISPVGASNYLHITILRQCRKIKPFLWWPEHINNKKDKYHVCWTPGNAIDHGRWMTLNMFS